MAIRKLNQRNELSPVTHPTLKEVCAIVRKICMALGIAAGGVSLHDYLPAVSVVQSEIPAYAKWSQLAIKETQVKYPRAEIIDYLHIGKQSKEGSAVEKFRLWLREENREFGVLVNITYSVRTEKLINIDFQEVHF